MEEMGFKDSMKNSKAFSGMLRDKVIGNKIGGRFVS